MPVSRERFAAVRTRANAACEYCGTTEEQSGGELTIDHFQPQSRDGSDDLDNLVYACFRCNSYKADCWPSSVEASRLWNPRESPSTDHFYPLSDGRLLALTPSGAESIRRLRLNREPLVRARRTARDEATREILLTRLVDLTEQIARVRADQMRLLADETALLADQVHLLNALRRLRD
jgi:hypothetical protein